MSNTNKPTGQQLATKEEVYAAHQALVNVVGGQYRKELDLLVKLAHTALAAIPAESSDDKKPLTAEFFLRNNEKTHWAANGPDGTGAPYIVYGTKRIAIIKAMEEYAAQQTAALREELQGEKVLVGMLSTAVKKLEDKLERSKERIDYYREAADKKDVTIQELERSIAKHAPIEAKAIRERDEAVALAENLMRFIDNSSDSLHEDHQLRDTLYRLSSGETKPVNAASSALQKDTERRRAVMPVNNVTQRDERVKTLNPYQDVLTRVLFQMEQAHYFLSGGFTTAVAKILNDAKATYVMNIDEYRRLVHIPSKPKSESPAQKAYQLTGIFDKISDYPVQCALAAVSEIIQALHAEGCDASYHMNVRLKLEAL